jgi:ATP-dependent RNA helicase DDX35
LLVFCPGFPVGAFPGFESYVTPGVTRLEFVTEGILLREMLSDPLLTRFSALAGAMGR